MRAESRPLGLLDVTCIGVNAVVGSSIFLFPDDLARLLGPASIISFGLTGLLLISVGLCFAEAASRFQRSGGPYVYASSAFGETTGFAIGWMCWVSFVFGWAAVANAIAEYLGYFGSAWSNQVMIKGMAAGTIIGMTALNYHGVKLGAWASNFFTAAKLLPLGVFLLAGLPSADFSRLTPFAPHGWSPMGSACFLAYFAFQGFETVPVPAGEAERPQRNIPLAVLLSLSFSAVLYMAIQAVALSVHPGLENSARPLADAAALVLGPGGAILIVLGAVFSTTGFTASSALITPRYLEALALDRHLPAFLSDRHPRYQTPYRAVLMTGGITLAVALSLDFKKLVDFSNVVVCAQYLAVCAAVPVLRRRSAGSPEPGVLVLPGGWFFPSAGIAATLWLGSQGGWDQVTWSLVILAGGFILRAATRYLVK